MATEPPPTMDTNPTSPLLSPTLPDKPAGSNISNKATGNTMSKVDQLYAKCSAAPPDTIFHQRDLAEMQVADDNNGLLVLIQQMVASWLMLTLHWDGVPCWKIRPRDLAEKMKAMSGDERGIFLFIEAAGTQAIWSKTLKTKTNTTQTALNKTLKHLESKGVVNCINNVKFPSRKYYVVAGLVPSEDVVGGPWHGDGELDLDLIDAISEIVVKYVEGQSWVQQKNGASKAAIARKRAVVLATSNIPDIEDVQPLFRPYLGRDRLPLVPQPAGYKHYPTCTSILAHIVESGLLNNLELKESDLQILLDNMVFDGKLERMGGLGYRTVRGASADVRGGDDYGIGNGFTEAPCGRCPVFALCEEGGPVNASTCVYFAEWLSKNV